MPGLHDARMISLAGSERSDLFNFSPTSDKRKGSIFCTAGEFLLAGLASAGDVCRALNGSGRMSFSSLPWDTKVVLASLVLHRSLLLGHLVFFWEQLKQH